MCCGREPGRRGGEPLKALDSELGRLEGELGGRRGFEMMCYYSGAAQGDRDAIGCCCF